MCIVMFTEAVTHRSYNMKATPVFTDECMDKQSVVSTYNGRISLSLKT